MSNVRMSKLAVVALAAGAVILLSAETTQAGGFSISIGGLSLGSCNTRCVQRSYLYIGDYDDGWGCTRVWRNNRCYRPRPRPRIRPYYGGGRFGTMPHRSGRHPHRR